MEHNVTETPAGQTTPVIRETVETIVRGEVPSNTQLQGTLQETIDSITQQTQAVSLSERGERLAHDAESLLKATQKFLSEKNADEKMQDFLNLSKEALQEASQRSEVILQELKDPQLTYNQEHLVFVARRLLFDLIYSKDFRNVLMELLELTQRIFWKRVPAVAESVASTAQIITSATVPPSLLTPSTVAPSLTNTLPTPATTPSSLTELTPDEQKELSEKFGKLLGKIGKNPEYHRGVVTVFRLVEQIRSKAKVIQHETYLTPKDQERLHQLWTDLKDILERFTGPKSLDPLTDGITQFYDLAANDPRTTEFFTTANKFIMEVLDNPNILKSEETNKNLKDLMFQAREIMSDTKYSAFSDSIFGHSNFLLSKFSQDPVTQELSQSFNTFVADLTHDAYTGKPSVQALQQSLLQLKQLLTPLILKQLQQIPIARVEGMTPTYDFILDNINFSVSDVVPEHIHVDLDTSIDINLTNSNKPDQTVGHLTVKIENIRTHIKDILFAYRRKSFPKFEDEGTFNVDTIGSGTTITIKWKVKSHGDKPMRFKLADAKCDISGLSFTIKEAQHSWLDSLVSAVFSKRVKHEMEKELDMNLRYVGNNISDSLNTSLSTLASTVKFNTQ